MNGTTNVTDMHVLIVGAGVSGLLIAQGLKKAGIKYTVFDTEEEGRWRAKEWTFGLHWALPLAEALLPPELAARIPTDGSVDPSLDWTKPPNNGSLIYDGITGDMMKDLTGSGRSVRVSRRRFRKLIKEGIDVHWDHTVQSVQCSEDESTVTATFTNGEQYTGTLLVGADGPRSSVRGFLFAHDPPLGQNGILEDHIGVSMAVSYDAETAKRIRSPHPVWYIGLSPKLFVFQSTQEVPDPEKPETWKFFLYLAWLGERDYSLDNAGRMRALKERASHLTEPFRSLVLDVPDDTQIPFLDVGYWIAKPWDTRKGLVTISGDAAHPMPPYRGQGGNHAVQDAYNFVEAVKKIASTSYGQRASVQAKIIQDFSNEVAERGGEETQLSIKNGYMSMGYTEFKDSPYMKQGLTRIDI